jgi:hypothetical protein
MNTTARITIAPRICARVGAAIVSAGEGPG